MDLEKFLPLENIYSLHKIILLQQLLKCIICYYKLRPFKILTFKFKVFCLYKDSCAFFNLIFLLFYSRVFHLLHSSFCDISSLCNDPFPLLNSYIFAKVFLSILSTCYLSYRILSLLCYPFNLFLLAFCLPLLCFHRDSNSSLFSQGISGALPLQQSASSSWRKLTGFHYYRAHMSTRQEDIQHPRSLLLSWGWNPGPLNVCSTYSKVRVLFPFYSLLFINPKLKILCT